MKPEQPYDPRDFRQFLELVLGRAKMAQPLSQISQDLKGFVPGQLADLSPSTWYFLDSDVLPTKPQTNGTQMATKKPTAATLIAELQKQIKSLQDKFDNLDNRVDEVADQPTLDREDVETIAQEVINDDESLITDDKVNELIQEALTDDESGLVRKEDLVDRVVAILSDDTDADAAIETTIRDILRRDNKLDEMIQNLASEVLDENLADKLSMEELVDHLEDPESQISTVIRDKISAAVNAAKLGEGVHDTGHAQPTATRLDLINEIEQRKALADNLRSDIKALKDQITSVNKAAHDRMNALDGIDMRDRQNAELSHRNLAASLVQLTREAAPVSAFDALKKRVDEMSTKVGTAGNLTEIKDLKTRFDNLLERHEALVNTVGDKASTRTLNDKIREAKDYADTQRKGATEWTDALRLDVDRCLREQDGKNRVFDRSISDTKLAAEQALARGTDLQNAIRTRDAQYAKLVEQVSIMNLNLENLKDAHNRNMVEIEDRFTVVGDKLFPKEEETKVEPMNLKAEASSAGYRIAVKQVTKTIQAPLVARFAVIDPEHTEILKLLARSELGRAAIAATLSVGVDYAGQKVPAQYAEVASRFAKECRVSAMADTADFALDILMEPLRKVICDTITKSAPQGVNTDVLEEPKVEEVVVMAAEPAQACAA